MGNVRRASDEKAFLVEPTKCAVGGNADWSKRCCVVMCIRSNRRLARVLPNLVCWQMVLDPDLRKEMGEDQWRPGFVDYLFLAFNTSTAFSPTDVPVLSRWAKVLMMVQASISLATLAILAARAVNIL